MARFCSLPASPAAALALVLVFALGGLVAPGVHRAQHAAEWAAERAAHVAQHHTGQPAADVPCAPAARDLDCALCTGLTTFALAASADDRADDRAPRLVPAEIALRRIERHVSARPRAPPAGPGRDSIG